LGTIKCARLVEGGLDNCISYDNTKLMNGMDRSGIVAIAACEKFRSCVATDMTVHRTRSLDLGSFVLSPR
jgi:hypothetical protein